MTTIDSLFRFGTGLRMGRPRSSWESHLRFRLFVYFVTLCCGCAPAERTPAQIQHDLVGHTMGGGETSWKFEVEDWADVAIFDYTNNVYHVGLQLRDGLTPEHYWTAEAMVTYDGRKIKSVGLLHIERVVP